LKPDECDPFVVKIKKKIKHFLSLLCILLPWKRRKNREKRLQPYNRKSIQAKKIVSEKPGRSLEEAWKSMRKFKKKLGRFTLLNLQ